MRVVQAIMATTAALALWATNSASASVVVTVDHASQRVSVEIDGAAHYLCRPESSLEQTAAAAATPITVIRGLSSLPVSQAGAFPRIITVR